MYFRMFGLHGTQMFLHMPCSIDFNIIEGGLYDHLKKLRIINLTISSKWWRVSITFFSGLGLFAIPFWSGPPTQVPNSGIGLGGLGDYCMNRLGFSYLWLAYLGRTTIPIIAMAFNINLILIGDLHISDSMPSMLLNVMYHYCLVSS